MGRRATITTVSGQACSPAYFASAQQFVVGEKDNVAQIASREADPQTSRGVWICNNSGSARVGASVRVTTPKSPGVAPGLSVDAAAGSI